MKTKAAIDITYGEPLVIDELEIADPKPDQVIVKLFSSGICHTQLHSMQSPKGKRPAVLGHEGTGVVTHIGRDIKHVKEGDHVIVTWIKHTPEGSILTDPPSALDVTYREETVHGGLFTWAEDTLVNQENVVPIDKELPTDVSGIVGCAVATGCGAVTHTAGVRPGDSVAVFGVGGVGLSTVLMAAILEAHPIIAVDIGNDKLEFAQQFGATHVVNASEVNPIETIKEICEGGVDFAFDTVGVRSAAEQVLHVTRNGGMAVLVGVDEHQMTVDPWDLVLRQLQLRGSLGVPYPEKNFPMYLRWHQQGKFPLDKLVTRRYKLEQINEACEALKAGEILGRAIIEF